MTPQQIIAKQLEFNISEQRGDKYFFTHAYAQHMKHRLHTHLDHVSSCKEVMVNTLEYVYDTMGVTGIRKAQDDVRDFTEMCISIQYNIVRDGVDWNCFD